MFPLACGFYPMWFAQSSTPMYINYKAKIQGCTFAKFNSHIYKLQKMKFKGAHLFLFCNWGSKEVLLLGACSMFQKNAGGPINMAPFKKKKKKL
jgi:hypothetical protein